MGTANQNNAEMQLAKTLAPEDVRRGDYITLLTKSIEYPSFIWGCLSSISDPSETVSISYRPGEAGLPLRVVDVCLPFILTELPNKKGQVIDVRAVRLAKISKSYAKTYLRLTKKKGKKKID